jgi:hypothetical protein
MTAPISSYWIKHVAERFLRYYVSNAALKGAMLEAGYEHVVPDDCEDPVNMYFRCGPRPRSPWAAQPQGPKVRGFRRKWRAREEHHEQ